MKFDFEYMLSLFPEIIKFLPIVLYIGTLSFLLAIVIGFFFSIIIKNKVKLLYPILKVIISYSRGVPTLIQIFILYFGAPQIFPSLSSMNAITAVIISLSLRNGAYLSEVFRSAFLAVDKEQYEACLSVNMTKWQALRTVILPQVVRITIPPAGNYYIMIIKDTSLAFTIGVIDMMARAKLEAAVSYKFLEAYLMVGLIYWMISIVLSFLQSELEYTVEKPYRKEELK
ncbi:MAG: amino acid ABC transporter permease [Candidatus Pristimantibacillus lignocellulolyticus]|uniref:Amino acid ABC transporter permease n=1 Tax=Candidatus Pristimantibacillus lignocellulolyticus TaxID=2994561 RepID=A0A9J6ZA98_9BACL|nr:MAG: amino acid ABC transporter permease [Candidatus Pristimantibacillus lignocellulolyticus]